MCGIVGYVGPKPVVPVLLEGLRKLEYRGYDSAGVAVVQDGAIEVRRSAGKLINLENAIQDKPLAGLYGLGHTRWATHGRPTEERSGSAPRAQAASTTFGAPGSAGLNAASMERLQASSSTTSRRTGSC